MTSVNLSQLASNFTSTPAAAQLQPGQIIDALVLKLINTATVRLQIPDGTIDVKSDVPLTPGTRVELSVQGNPAQPTLVVRALPVDSRQPLLQPEIGSNPDNVRGATSVGSAIVAQANDPALPSDRASAVEAVLQSAAAILRNAASRQSGLASLYADIEAILAQPTAAAPEPVGNAIRQLLAMRLDIKPDAGIEAGEIKAAMIRSGLLSSLGTTNGPPPGAGSSDLRTALLFLRQTLKAWIASEPIAKENPGTLLQKSIELHSVVRAAGPMPPYRNASMVPQAPVTSSIATNASSRDLAIHLLDETEGALARDTLLQIASLPDGPEAGATSAGANSDRMTFDVPLASAQGTAIAQVRIEREGKKKGGSNVESVWRASFSIDIEPIGPVHVRIAMTGKRTMVSMNAGRVESARRLSEALPLLEAGLRRSELEPGELVCHAGTPRPLPTAPGQFMDHAT